MELQDPSAEAGNPIDPGELTAELLGVVRLFGAFERVAVCCGTVTIPQCLVLQELLARDPEPADISSLAGAAGGSVSAMTRLVDGLEKRDFVERTKLESDRRRVGVRLTDAGRDEARRLLKLTEQAVQAVLSLIPAADHRTILRSMSQVRAAMAQAAGAFGM